MEQTIRQQDWESMPRTMRLAAIEGMEPLEIAKLYEGMRPLAGIGPRLSREEWRALGRAGQAALLPLLEPWEAAIVRGWTRQDRRNNPLLWRRLGIAVLLAYPAFCAMFALYGGLRSFERGNGFTFRFWHCMTSDVPGLFRPEIPICDAVREYLSDNFDADTVQARDGQWLIRQEGDARRWSVSLRVRMIAAGGAGIEIPATFVVVCDEGGYRVHHVSEWGMMGR